MNNNKQYIGEYLIIDWGTSNFRIFLMNNEDKLVKKKETEMGLLKVENGNFAKSLQNILTSWLPNYQNLPIFMAGMVGSANGWHTVDYVETHSDIAKLSHGSFHFKLPWQAPATIIPGILHVNTANNTKDVMRGEEVQVFGLINKCGFNNLKAILPGTHSKHVNVSEGKITEVASYMTGELFSVISQHTILGKNLPPQQFDTEAFTLGVIEGQTAQLTQVLFQVRTHQLFNRISASHVESYLSGLLIGNELQTVEKQPIYLIGSPALCNKYQLACNILTIPTTYIDGDECFLSGMVMLVQKILSIKH